MVMRNKTFMALSLLSTALLPALKMPHEAQAELIVVIRQ